MSANVKSDRPYNSIDVKSCLKSLVWDAISKTTKQTGHFCKAGDILAVLKELEDEILPKYNCSPDYEILPR